ncbi:hypothetical protein A2771_02375 [Candidatus Woesebacteria bacterium RIFCSPHIGHO2_01_FULL_38_26b]|uniref:Methyltransferase domain-containing protein n=1 Tax=Candidatus Woesebacteria bacterium RIFCSPHIGHO2_01_FULL_38_26b TaxID=1802491 RepID=A0A1F7Y0D1_9BACT|nr:MAG: hypothetical protein A2771_02375 [Candidatus Woesebacteria bacterium RIFCSPHIGHO2_01_FULL_38_26b]
MEDVDVLPKITLAGNVVEAPLDAANSPIVIIADEALLNIRKLTYNHRPPNLFDKDIKREEIEDITQKLSEESQQVAHLLKGWKYAFGEFGHLRWTNPDSEEEDFWDKKSMDYYKVLDSLLWLGIGTRKLESVENLSKEESSLLDEGGLKLIHTWITSKDFESKKELLDFLKYDLWLSWRWMVLSKSSISGEENPEFVRGFERKKQLLLPIFIDVVKNATQNGKIDEIKSVFEGLDNIGDETEAEKILFLEGLSDEQRLTIAVEFINQFGYIKTIDLIAGYHNDENQTEVFREQLKNLYGALQGNEAKEIAKELSDIYEKVDFSNYKLNESELTTMEAGIIDNAISGLEKVRNGNDKKRMKLLDIGAGTGRHCTKLYDEGYEDITALEYEQKHVEFIRSKKPNLKIIKGDWKELSSLIGTPPKGDTKIDFAYSLGRSISHNRTPSDMFHLFDEVQLVMTDNGRFLFDEPDVNWGIYLERINNFRENLEKKGVHTLQSGIIFDGPNDTDKFNRQVLRPDQIKSLAFLLGFELVEERSKLIGGKGEIKNTYYTFEMNKEWNPQSITPEELNENLKGLGLLDPGADFNMYIDAWGMTLGQALIYVHNFGLGNEYMRYLNKEGKAPDILIEFDGSQINPESRGMSKHDHIIATIARGMRKAEVDKLLIDIKERKISMQELEVRASTR